MFNPFQFSEISGWLFLVVYLIFFRFLQKKYQSSTVITVFVINFCIRQIIAFTDAYTIIGSYFDAQGFQDEAINISRIPFGDWEFRIGWVYSKILGEIYRLFGESWLLGRQFSVLASLVSLVILFEIAKFITKKNLELPILILGSVSITSYFFGSMTLREPFQALFLLFGILSIFRYSVDLKSKNAIFALISFFMMGLLHDGLLPYSFFLVTLSYFYFFYEKTVYGISKAALFAFIIGGTLFLMFTNFGNSSSIISSLQTNDSISVFNDKRIYSDRDAGSNYAIKGETLNLPTISRLFLNYFFAPFPWQIRSISDAYVLVENFLRFILMFYSFILFLSNRMNKKISFLLIAYFSLEFLWSLGTTAWGTAIRHHIPAHGILILLGVLGYYARETNTTKLQFGRT
jgi:hypothetical protein